MRPIHENRRKLEQEHHERLFTRGTKHIFHYENLYGFVPFVKLVLAATFLRKPALRNAENVALNKVDLRAKGLPAGFDGCRVLFIADAHFGTIDNFAERIIALADKAEYDYCVLGGDYSLRFYPGQWRGELDKLARFLRGKSRVFAVLGNHDDYGTAEQLHGHGVEVLINEHVCLERGGDRIYLAGIDDCHYYASAELEEAQAGITDGAFKVLVSHSPELYAEAERAGFSLYLAGHTHAGQLCLPGGIAVMSRTPGPRMLIRGKWEYGDMVGYTSSGAGSAGVAARFFCPPEVALLTLAKDK
jgi:predicted MPP superfamily phosphohydrolase